MAGTLLNRKKAGMHLPTRRVLAIDAGTRRVKLLLMHSDFGRLRILRHEWVDLRAEGLVSPEEIQAHLQAVIRDLGHPPLALIIPEHLSASHVIDLPPTPETEVRRQIGDEAVKLSGVSDSRVIYDFARLESHVANRQHFWVTLCQEENIRGQIAQLGVEQEDISEVTTTANALITAHRVASPSPSRAVLVHMGAQTTVLSGVHGSQGAFASSIQMGSDFLTRTIARYKGVSEEAAEALKASQDLFRGPDACKELIEAINGWADEVKRQVIEARKQNPVTDHLDPSKIEMVWSGGGFHQRGLLEHLDGLGLRFRPWPEDTVIDGLSCPSGFEVAFGTALQALGHSSQPISLVPEDYRSGWKKRIGRQRIELASLGLVILCALALAIGTVRKVSMIRSKEALLTQINASQEAVESNDMLMAELLSRYDEVRPVFAAQQNTRDTLKTLSFLQQTRTNGNLWYLIVADQQTYFGLPRLEGAAASNRAVSINIEGDLIRPATEAAVRAREAAGRAIMTSGMTVSTNAHTAKPGCIAELCLPGDSDSVRRTLQQVVASLKQTGLFSQADLLSEDLRRNLADPRLLTQDRHFVIALDFAEPEFHQAVNLRRPPATAGKGKRDAVRGIGREEFR